LIQHALHDPELCRAYGIGKISVPSVLWQVKTPNSVPGKTVQLAQVCVLPRYMNGQDVGGHLHSDKRKNVAITRGRKILSYHLHEECLQTAAERSPWFALYKDIVEGNLDGELKRITGSTREPIHWNEPSPADAKRRPSLNAAFGHLGNFYTDLPQLVSQLKKVAAAKLTRPVLRSMSLAQALIKSILPGDTATDGSNADALDDVSSGEIAATGKFLERHSMLRQEELSEMKQLIANFVPVLHHTSSGNATMLELHIMKATAAKVLTDRHLDLTARFVCTLLADWMALGSSSNTSSDAPTFCLNYSCNDLILCMRKGDRLQPLMFCKWRCLDNEAAGDAITLRFSRMKAPHAQNLHALLHTVMKQRVEPDEFMISQTKASNRKRHTPAELAKRLDSMHFAVVKVKAKLRKFDVAFDTSDGSRILRRRVRRRVEKRPTDKKEISAIHSFPVLMASGCLCVESWMLFGAYHPHCMHNDKIAYKKNGSGCWPDAFIYFSTGNVPSQRGWWIGTEIEGNNVWGFHPHDQDLPPMSGWNIPHDEKINPMFHILYGMCA
jgi:hypothetical protein